MKDVHTEHCCVLHGCKYSDDDCTVVTRNKMQSFTCERCKMELIKEIPDPDDSNFDLLRMTEYGLREECIKLRKQLTRLDGPCAICGEWTNSIIGDPSKWALHFCSPGGEPGVVRPHHVGCINKKLRQCDDRSNS